MSNFHSRDISRRGSGFYEMFCIFAKKMSCLCIHLVTLFNLPCNFFCRGIVFSSSQSVYFGEITRVMQHICIFSRDMFSPPIFS